MENEKIEKLKSWLNIKIIVDKKEFKIFFKVRDIFFANIGENIGKEQNGKGEEYLRPVLIFKKFGKDLAFVIPLSTKIKENDFCFTFKSSKNTEMSALLSQAKTIDTRRLKFKIGSMNNDDFTKLKKRFTNLFDL